MDADYVLLLETDLDIRLYFYSSLAYDIAGNNSFAYAGLKWYISQIEATGRERNSCHKANNRRKCVQCSRF